MIDGESLAAFVAIAETRSFSRAAERLGTVQSVVSKRLQRLEDQLSAPLMDRRQRSRIRLTRVGELFLPEAVETLARLGNAERRGRSLARGQSGPFHIGFIFSAALNGTLTTVLAGLRAAFAELIIQPRLMETPEQLAALADGTLDIGLMRPRPTYPDGCAARRVHSERLLIALSAQHPLMAHPTLTPAMLAGARLVIPQFQEQVGFIESLRQLARQGGFAEPPVIPTADFVTAASIASAGDGLVVAPASLANLRLQGLCYREIAGFDEQVSTVLVSRADAPAAALDVVAALFPASEPSAGAHAPSWRTPTYGA